MFGSPSARGELEETFVVIPFLVVARWSVSVLLVGLDPSDEGVFDLPAPVALRVGNPDLDCGLKEAKPEPEPEPEPPLAPSTGALDTEPPV